MKLIKSFIRIVYRGLLLIYVCFTLLFVSGLDIENYRFVLEPMCTEIMPYSEGLALVKIDGSYGFVDQHGNFVIEPQYAYAESFSQGLAVASRDGKFGYINQSNEWVIKPFYEDAGPFHGDYAVIKDGNYGLINKNAEILLDTIYHDLYLDDVIHYQMDNQYGFIYLDYQSVSYDYIGHCHEELLVFQDEKYGYLNLNGQVVIPAIYSEARCFYSGHAVVKTDEHYGVINSRGKVVIPFIYDDIQLFDEYIGIKIGYNWGYIDYNGKVIVEPQYDLVHPFIKGIAHVTVNKRHGMINEDNDEVIGLTYNDIGNDFNWGLNKVKVNIFYGYIDRNNHMVIEPKFDQVTQFFDNRTAYVKKDGKWGIITRHYRVYYYMLVLLPLLVLSIIRKFIIRVYREVSKSS